jgi:hypothetical protein
MPIRSPALIGRFAVNVCSPVPAGVAGALVPTAVLKKVCTASNGFGATPGGSTLPTVTVAACAPVAANSASALAATIVTRPRLFRCFI